MGSKMSAGLVALVAVGTVLSVASTSASLEPAVDEPTTSGVSTTTDPGSTTTTDPGVSTTTDPGVSTTTDPGVSTTEPATTTSTTLTTTTSTTSTTTTTTLPGAMTPEPPRNVRGEGAYRQVRLTWTVPLSNGGPPVTGYVIQQRSGTAPEQWSAVATTTGTSFTVTGLANNVQYFFRVAARNAAGVGIFAATIGGVTTAVPHGPELKQPGVGNGSITVGWYGVGGASVAGFRIEVSNATSPGWRYVATAQATATRYTITGLANGQRYHVRVGTMMTNGDLFSSTATSAVPARFRARRALLALRPETIRSGSTGLRRW